MFRDGMTVGGVTISADGMAEISKNFILLNGSLRGQTLEKE